MRKTRIGKSILTIMLTIIMVLQMLLPCFTAFADQSYWYKGGAGTKVSDLDTSTKYSESLGDNASTEYAGRIWTDKSVYTDDVTFNTFGGGTSTIKLNNGGNLGEDFLIAYSALATAQSVSGQTQAPVDVVLIIDISGSMSNSDSNMDNGLSRIYNTVQATNAAIDKLMALNPYTRVSVVAFSSNAQVLLPLDRYTKETETEREWVSTGPRPFDGYYEETEVEVPYFSLSRQTGSNNYATLYTNAVNSTGTTVEKTTSVEGGTNIQVGLYEGMQVLAEEDSTTVNIGGATVQRVPSVILLSDGSPTYSSSSTSWWAPSDNNNDGPGRDPYAGNGMKAIMVGSYMKDAVDRNYKVAGTAFATTVYTIGMGITGLDNSEKNLAYMTLDPGTYWNDTNVTNSMKTAIKGYWASYTANNNTGTPNINVGKTDGWDTEDDYYRLTHPTTGYDVDPIDGYDYVDDYYDADNASAVTDVFNEIVSSISISAPQVPTEIKGSDPMTDGYITYTDPIGEYMEVKDVKAIIYAGTTFTAKETAVNGNTTTYTFSGTVNSPVYGHQELKNIIITVEETDGKQTLVIKIPASVIPLRVNEVMLNADGSVKTHTNNGTLPARVIYSVGLQSEILKEADNGVVYVDRTKLSAEYLNANTNDDGTINFYSNEYTNPHLINGSTVGDTTVEFEPSHSNSFYYILEDMPIYKDAEFKEQVTEQEGLDDDTVYYYRDEYYHGTSVEVDAIERTGTQLKATEIKTGSDGKLYRATGSPRLNRILKFEGTKVYNNTNTAEDFYAPEFHYADTSTSAYDGKFIVHLGNNGLLSMVAGGNLQISKTVNAAPGLTAPDKTFEFTIDLDGENVNSGTYDYVIVDAAGEQVSTGTVSASNTKISLKDGQTATIFSLPPDTTYVVTETAQDGFVVESSGATGTIVTNETSVAAFTNTYNVTPVTYPAQDSLKGTKRLERPGNVWTQDDVFTFFITPYNNAPLPENYDAAKGVVVDGPDVAGGNTATFDFGSIKFTAPGTYRYTIVEKEPENNEYLPGMTYSGALYRVVITVVDNGNGTLSITNSDIQKLYSDDATPLFAYNDNDQIVMNSGEEGQDAIEFVNRYNADSVTRVPVALKDYTDNSGQKPLVSGMFEFELKALGIVDVQNDSDFSDDPIITDSADNVPMPQGSVNGVITTTNEGHNITFPAVEFTQNDIPAGMTSVTFRYQMRELAGSVNGMTYDDTVYTVNVTVSVDSSGDTLNVNAVYPDGTRIVTFYNSYTPDPVYDNIEGSKTLNGRDMLSGEKFEFVLGANAATSLAIRNGDVVVPDAQYVENAKDGVVTDFTFENIRFNKAGTYVFTVNETQGSAAGVKYDDTVYTVTIVVDDTDNDGKLEIVSNTNDNGPADFVNTYTSEFNGTPVSLSGTKNLTGKTLLAGEFYFDVVEYLNGQKISENYVTHAADTEADTDGVYSGSITLLEDVTYTKAGRYEYIITEQIPDNKVGGTTYDEGKYRYTVTVEDDNAGNLRITSESLEKADGLAWVDAEAIVFNNTYVPDDTTAHLPLIKKVISGDRTEPLKAGEFEFELKQVSADPEGGMTLPSKTVVANAANGDVVFGNITFSKAGTYVVSVNEIIPDDADKVAGIAYSTQTITATYRVTDDRNGTLTAVLVQYVGGEVIVNQYNAKPATAKVEIDKSFTGRNNDEWLATDKFEFEIKLDSDTAEAVKNGDIELVLDSGSEDTATKVIDEKGEKVAVDIKINKIGTYRFTVTEKDNGIAGVIYDTQPREVVIVAEDDSANAQITVKINGQSVSSSTLTFTNEYNAQASEPIAITAKKKVSPSEGNAYTLKAGDFSFTIEGSQNAPMPAVTTISNDDSGVVDFGTLSFTEAGTYVYKLREVQGNRTGFGYDDEVFTVTVEVTDDTVAGKLKAVAKITDSSNNEAEAIFDNAYTPKQVTATIFGSKTLDSEHKNLEANEFEFVIESITQNAPMPSENTVKNAADGTFSFGDITFTKVGEYEYLVTEKDLGKRGYTYDDKSYTVTVTVTDNSGVLEAAVDGVGTVAEPVIRFTNEYEPDSVIVVLGADGELLKSLDGRDINTEEFIFAVIDSENDEITTAKNDENGKFKFTLSFTKADTYKYTIVEKNNGLGGITYDPQTYGVEIVIVDKGGYLEAESVTYSSEDEEVTQVVFNNSYKAADTSVIISAVKELSGRELKDGEFKFVLKNEKGEVIAIKSNTKDGKIVFDKIDITAAGTYKFTLTEETGILENVTYDKSEYVIVVEVVDKGEGKLEALTPVITKTGSSDKITEIVFENTYTVPTLPAVPETGDNTNLNLWIALLFVSGGGLLGTAIYGKKRKETEEN